MASKASLKVSTPKISSPKRDEIIYTLAGESPFAGNEAQSASRLIASIGGLGAALDGQISPVNAIHTLATAVENTYRDMTSASEAQPPPAEFIAGFRFIDFIYNTNGDIAQTVDVPVEILAKPVRYSSKDEGADREWKTLWGGEDSKGLLGVSIDSLFEEFLYENEVYANTFPLELWDNDLPKGIAMLEPHSMWVGSKVTNNFQYSLMVPGTFEKKKFADMVHKLAYHSFNVDQNVQSGRYTRVPINPDSIEPIYGRKFAFKRYATSQMLKAGRNVLHRMLVEEARRGTIEGLINQILLFTTGAKEDSPQVIKDKIKTLNGKLKNQKNERTGLMVSDYTTKGEIIAPKSDDDLTGVQTWSEITQAIFRDLGFSVFFLTGELPGQAARGGQQMEVNVQFAIERWKYKQRKILRWFDYFSRKYATRQNSKALLANLPTFSMDQIGIEQTAAIKDRIVPMYMAGLLDPQQALVGAGYNYELTVKNKRAAMPNADLFEPPTIYKQEAVNLNGDDKQVAYSPRGRQPDSQNLDRINASLKDPVRDWTDDINAQFDAAMQNGDVTAFANWMRAELRARLERAYSDGCARGGGVRQPNAQRMNESPQGIHYHLGRLDGFEQLLVHTPREDLEYQRYRATLYSAAAHTLYLLGYQQAMQEQGAKHWQRVSHTEFSETGPCAHCLADAINVHPIDEPYAEMHPHRVCSVQTMDFHFGNQPRRTAPVPDYGTPTLHRARRFPTAAS